MITLPYKYASLQRMTALRSGISIYLYNDIEAGISYFMSWASKMYVYYDDAWWVGRYTWASKIELHTLAEVNHEIVIINRLMKELIAGL